MNIEEELEQLIKQNNIGPCRNCGGRMVMVCEGKYTCRVCGEIELDEEGQVRDYLEKNGPVPYAVAKRKTQASAKTLSRFWE